MFNTIFNDFYFEKRKNGLKPTKKVRISMIIGESCSKFSAEFGNDPEKAWNPQNVFKAYYF